MTDAEYDSIMAAQDRITAFFRQLVASRPEIAHEIFHSGAEASRRDLYRDGEPTAEQPAAHEDSNERFREIFGFDEAQAARPEVPGRRRANRYSYGDVESDEEPVPRRGGVDLSYEGRLALEREGFSMPNGRDIQLYRRAHHMSALRRAFLPGIEE